MSPHGIKIRTGPLILLARVIRGLVVIERLLKSNNFLHVLRLMMIAEEIQVAYLSRQYAQSVMLPDGDVVVHVLKQHLVAAVTGRTYRMPGECRHEALRY